MTRLITLLLAAVGLAHAAAERPNILFCIADDWGWPHASAYANDPVVQTPAFDRVAAEGALFHHAYVSSPSCTPSRNAILTGQFHWRLGPGASLWSTLDQNINTFPLLLEDAGYAVGSWRKSWGPGRLDGKWLERHPAGPVFEGGFPEFLAARDPAKPFFFWLGAKDPHRPYERDTGAASGMDLAAINLFEHFPDVPEVRGDVADYYFEVQRFDSDVAAALSLLEEIGEADNTIVVITGDHGMPFPRCKSNLYDSGTRVPLAIRWPTRMQPAQSLEGFVSLTDLAPTFLAAAGVSVPLEMTGHNLLPAILTGDESKLRQHILFGKERHVPSQAAPDMGGYPSRALRTSDYLYIRNYTPERWPNGIEDWANAAIRGVWYGDTDNGPTKTYIVENRDRDWAHQRFWELNFGLRPAEELYDLSRDPGQLINVAADPDYATTKAELAAQLTEDLVATLDPREHPHYEFDFDAPPYLGRGPRHPDSLK